MDLLSAIQRSLRGALVRRGAKSLTVTLAGLPIHYYDISGSAGGCPILLVHGLGSSANGWYKVLFPLARRFRRVVAPDIPGHGFSGGEPGNLAESVRLLADFCEQVVGEPVFAVGNSLGGALCLALAIERPQSVKALGLIAPAGARLAAEQFAEISSALQVRNRAQARALTRRLFHRATWASLLFASLLPGFYGSPSVRKVLAAVDANAFLSPEALARIAVPTLLLWGKSEKLLPVEALQYFKANLPARTQVEIVDGFGHVPQIERPRELVRRLVAFAEQVGL